MGIVLENRLVQCDVCDGRGRTLEGPHNIWDIADVLSLSKSDFEWEECYECQGTGWMGLEKVEVEHL